MPMKYLIPYIVLILWLCCCKSPAVLPFQYPDDLPETDKKQFTTQFYEGEKLYAMHCAGCHNIKLKNRDSIPTFSLPQLMDYEIRFQYPVHQDSMTEEKISPQELDEITLFLRYRKPG